jgi:hypothetical protein
MHSLLRFDFVKINKIKRERVGFPATLSKRLCPTFNDTASVMGPSRRAEALHQPLHSDSYVASEHAPGEIGWQWGTITANVFIKIGKVNLLPLNPQPSRIPAGGSILPSVYTTP